MSTRRKIFGFLTDAMSLLKALMLVQTMLSPTQPIVPTNVFIFLECKPCVHHEVAPPIELPKTWAL
ncbi:hypothetical protein [Pseudomonas sp. CBZ-4]|jgi:hypothetical protein|uniref:hypothetical protein n=1 Tax=Pseudomonas sp. CBZ-4 TaxID=1163065 RepID=UPI0012FA4165|nr:hypothetical protein [Pseudomonas sp. CBZ-4]